MEGNKNTVIGAYSSQKRTVSATRHLQDRLEITDRSQLWLTGCRPHNSWGKELRLVCFITSHWIILNHIYTAKGNVKQSCLLIYPGTGGLLNRQKLLSWLQNLQNWVWLICFECQHIMNSPTWLENKEIEVVTYWLQYLEEPRRSSNSQQSLFSIMSNLLLFF